MAPPITVSRFCLRVIRPSPARARPQTPAIAPPARSFRQVPRHRAPARRAPASVLPSTWYERTRRCQPSGSRGFSFSRSSSRATIVSIIALRSSGDICDAAAISSASGPAWVGPAIAGAAAWALASASAWSTTASHGEPAGSAVRMVFQAVTASARRPCCANAPARKNSDFGCCGSSWSARWKAACASAVIAPPATAAIASPSPDSRAGRGAGELDGAAIRLDGILIAPDPEVDRRQHVPAAAILRGLLQMGFGARDQLIDRLLGRIDGEPRRQRLRRHVGRAERAVKPPADQRHRQHRCKADSPARLEATRRPETRRRAGSGVLVRYPEDAAGDFGTRLLAFGSTDQAARGIAIKLGELVAIDFKVMRGRLLRARRPAHDRQQHRQDRGDSEQRGGYPKQHAGLNIPAGQSCQPPDVRPIGGRGLAAVRLAARIVRSAVSSFRRCCGRRCRARSSTGYPEPPSAYIGGNPASRPDRAEPQPPVRRCPNHRPSR